MIEQKDNLDVACFEVNAHGRILSGNRRFCRMFGYNESELIWHYITDFYRHASDWEFYKNCEDMEKRHFVVRMRNRKGRSFKCSVCREVSFGDDGKLVYRNTVRRVSESAKAAAPTAEIPKRSEIYVAKCAHCGSQVQVKSRSEIRMKTLCGECAAKLFPEAFALKTLQL